MRHAIAMLITALWAGFTAMPAVAERVALVIGNAEYARSNPLANPVNDAIDMAERLSEIGYRLHSGGPMTNLTEREMSIAVRDFTNSLQEGDLALFYFAGHGAQYKGDAYLIPVDDEEIEFANELSDFAYNAETVLQRIAAIPDVTALMILDACRNLPLPERPTGNRDLGEQTTGLPRMEIPPGSSSILMYATAPNQVSSDGEGRNGTFTGALLRALEDPGRRIDDIHYEVASMVREETGGYQVPWIELGFAGTTPPLFSELSAPTPDPVALVIGRTWAMIQTIEDPLILTAAIEGFLETFPDAEMAEEAQLRLVELRALAILPDQPDSSQGSGPATGAKPGRGVLALGIPHFGTVALMGPPAVEGSRFALLAGGFEQAITVGDECRGFIASHPDYQLDYDETMGRLTLSAESAVPLSLVVRTPDGAWLCSSAAEALPPMIDLAQPLAGAYRIWVGTMDQQQTAPTASLVIFPMEAESIRRDMDRSLPEAGANLDLPLGPLQ